MIRFIAVVFGIAFIFAGVAGFLPVFTVNNALFGIFAVDTMHNLVHIVSGVIAIMAATSFKWTKLYFLIFGIVYTLVAVIGFARGSLLMMELNTADNFLHLGIGLACLFLVYYARKQVS